MQIAYHIKKIISFIDMLFLGLIIIFIVFFLVSIFKQDNTVQLVEFNAPYKINAKDLTNILRDLQTIPDQEFDITIMLYGKHTDTPEIPFQQYFTFNNVTCTVVEERAEKKKVYLTLHFVRSTE